MTLTYFELVTALEPAMEEERFYSQQSIISWLTAAALLVAWIIHRLFLYFCDNFHVFSAQGIPGPRPIPVFGTWWKIWEHSPHELALAHRKKYGPIYATFRGPKPILHVHDLELMRAILVKDSREHFGHRYRRPVAGENDYVNKTLSMLKGGQWKAVRALVVGAFTPKVMQERVSFVDESILQCVSEWKQIATKAGRMDLKIQTELLCKEVMMNYSVGRKLGTIGHPDHPFVLNARKAIEGGRGTLAGTLIRINPKLLPWLRPFIESGNDYFVKLSRQILKERSKNGDHGHHHVTSEPDLVDRLLACLQDGNAQIDVTVVIAQLTSIILSGYDEAGALARLLHCLTVNPEAQSKCRAEIMEARVQHARTFSMGLSLPYVEQCLREALRLYPTSFSLNRVCTKEKIYEPTEIGNGDGQDFASGIRIPKGTGIECPTFVLHRDPSLYPKPLTFNPDRFAPDGEPPLSLSFGQGPRGCTSKKFALGFLKHCLFHILPEFEFFPVVQTQNLVEFVTGPSGVLTAAEMVVGVRQYRK